MSQNPAMPAELMPLAPGYTRRQIEIDSEMVALGRPVSSIRTVLDPKALALHRATVEAWEYAHPDEAVRWLELRSQAKAEEARLYEERYGPESYTNERMRLAGFTNDNLVQRASRELRDTTCFTAAREWMRVGTTWSLTLIGAPGCGKSQAATWAALQLMGRGFSPRCAMCPKVSESPLYGGEAEEYRWRCASAGMLVLDDLGEGEQRGEKRGAWRAWIDDVLTQRHAASKKTIITTNRSVDQLTEWLGLRMTDRLREGIIVSTSGKSLRVAP